MPNKIYIDIECKSTKSKKFYGSAEANYIVGKQKLVFKPIQLFGTPYIVLGTALKSLTSYSKDFNLVFSTFNYMNDNKKKVNNLIKKYKLTNTHVVHAKSNNPKIKELRKQILSYLNKIDNDTKYNMNDKKSIAHVNKSNSNNKSTKSSESSKNSNNGKTMNSKIKGIHTNTPTNNLYAKSAFLNSEKLLSRFSRFSVQLTNQGKSLEKLSRQNPQSIKEQNTNKRKSVNQTNSKISKPKKVQPKVSSSDTSNKQLKIKLQGIYNKLSVVEKLASLPRHTKKISLKDIHQWLGDSDSVGLAKEIIKYLTDLNFITKAKHNTYKVNLRVHKNIF